METDNNLIKETKIKEFIHNKGYRVSTEYVFFIDKHLEELIGKSIDRALLNKRTTLLKQDI